jgi:hypothetical protein
LSEGVLPLLLCLCEVWRSESPAVRSGNRLTCLTSSQFHNVLLCASSFVCSAPEGIWDALTGHASLIGYDVIRHQRSSENGYCDFLNKKIAVRPGVSPAQAVKTLIHELGHTLLHAKGGVASREPAEVEVESVAFIVCDALGLDSGGYGFPYVTRWAEGSEELVKQTAGRGIGCAKRILERLEVSREGDA